MIYTQTINIYTTKRNEKLVVKFLATRNDYNKFSDIDILEVYNQKMKRIDDILDRTNRVYKTNVYDYIERQLTSYLSAKIPFTPDGYLDNLYEIGI
jgi:hypothetical protein